MNPMRGLSFAMLELSQTTACKGGILLAPVKGCDAIPRGTFQCNVCLGPARQSMVWADGFNMGQGHRWCHLWSWFETTFMQAPQIAWKILKARAGQVFLYLQSRGIFHVASLS